jgi:hypothetical protein
LVYDEDATIQLAEYREWPDRLEAARSISRTAFASAARRS